MAIRGLALRERRLSEFCIETEGIFREQGGTLDSCGPCGMIRPFKSFGIPRHD